MVLTSSGCEPAVVTPILASLQAAGVNLRAVDGGRVGGDGTGAVDWVMRTLGGDMLEQQLGREVDAFRPDALVCFEAGAARVACALRDRSPRPFPILAVIHDLEPSAAWSQSEADRYFVVDETAAVHLEDHSVPGHRIVPVGVFGEYAFAHAGAESRTTLKKKFGLSGSVVLALVEGLGVEASGQLALQLSLVSGDVTFLFDAGDDTEVAATLRAQVPMLDMKAKLFGRIDDAPLLWRSASIVVAQPTESAIARALAVGAKVICHQPVGSAETRLANALEQRGQGAIAVNALMVGSALEGLLAASSKKMRAAGDGAALVADATFLIGAARSEVMEERHAKARVGRESEVADASDYAAWAAKTTTPPGALEDLGTGGYGGGTAAPPRRPDAQNLQRLKREIHARKAQVSRTIADAQKQTAGWEKKAAKAKSLDNATMARSAERNADLERARMHSALAEMAGLEAEEASLRQAANAAAKAPAAPKTQEPPPKVRSGSGTSVRSKRSVRSKPSVAEELERLRKEAGGASTAPKKKSKKKASKKRKAKKGGAVDDELAALKRKMAKKRRT